MNIRRETGGQTHELLHIGQTWDGKLCYESTTACGISVSSGVPFVRTDKKLNCHGCRRARAQRINRGFTARQRVS